jgi:hypothetical protein
MDGREVYRILGMLERKEKEQGERGRSTTKRTGMPVKKWKD